MNKYIVGALASIFSIAIIYFIYFNLIMGYPFSSSADEWSGFGDYFGGILNPILSFIAVVLLIKSLHAQNDANQCLIHELENNDKSENLRKFENLFFNLIGSQRDLYKGLKLNVPIQHKVNELEAEKALFIIDSRIEYLKETGGVIGDIKSYIVSIDREDRIYSLIRAFSLIVRLISERLSNDKKFELEDRQLYFTMLINLTDFTHLRLVLFGMMYLDCYPAEYLKEHIEFIEILRKLGFDIHENI